MTPQDPDARAAITRAWRDYFEGSARLTAEVERRLKSDTDLDIGDFNVLLLLSEADGERMRMGELARGLAFAPGRLTYQIQSLERHGWVLRERSVGDARGTDACLTPAGRRALRVARPKHARAIDEVFLSRVTTEQAAVLSELFAPLRQGAFGVPDCDEVDESER